MPVSRIDMSARDWYYYDFLLVTGDAYVDHPSFGAAIISRILSAEGFRVAILAQPSWQDNSDLAAMGRPRYAALLTAGNIDSMVAHYTVAKKRRHSDSYSPGNRVNLRPDRACLVYARLVRQAFPGLPIILGGLEASLRRFAHYDYWDDKVRRSLLVDAQASLLVYGMGERATREIARRLAAGEAVESLTDIRGTCYVSVTPPARPMSNSVTQTVILPSFTEVHDNRRAYAEATRLQYVEQDAVRGRTLSQAHGALTVVQNPPARPLSTREFDAMAELPYTRSYHPSYEALGGVPALQEVRFSLIHNRGCFGGCHFCSLAFHQGREIAIRSEQSLLREAAALTRLPDFKGYIHDVGGATANFRHPSCRRQLRQGLCAERACLTPEPCPNLDTDQSGYVRLLRRLRALPGIKKVFVRSGLRYDYLLLDTSGECLSELVKHHISGQLKVAPEHCVDHVLDTMGKPRWQVYEKFMARYARLNARHGRRQFLVPYLISSHPGCRLEDAVTLAEILHRQGLKPEQVQDFYPTPGTLATAMYHTGLDPRTLEPVYIPKSAREKARQRALLQWWQPSQRALVVIALRQAGREDLIGYGKKCLVRPRRSSKP